MLIVHIAWIRIKLPAGAEHLVVDSGCQQQDGGKLAAAAALRPTDDVGPNEKNARAMAVSTTAKPRMAKTPP